MTQLRSDTTHKWHNSGMTQLRNDTTQESSNSGITQLFNDATQITWLRKILKRHNSEIDSEMWWLKKKDNSEWHFLELRWLLKMNDFKGGLREALGKIQHGMSWLSNEVTQMTWRSDDLNAMTWHVNDLTRKDLTWKDLTWKDLTREGLNSVMSWLKRLGSKGLLLLRNGKN